MSPSVVQVPTGSTQVALRKRKALRTPLDCLFPVTGFFCTANGQNLTSYPLCVSLVALSHGLLVQESLGQLHSPCFDRACNGAGSAVVVCSPRGRDGAGEASEVLLPVPGNEVLAGRPVFKLHVEGVIAALL